MSKTGLYTSPLINDGMVIQRDSAVKIWGKETKNSHVVVKFQDKVYSCAVDEENCWQIVLENFEPGGPYSMIIEGSQTIEIKDVLVGDVYLLSGQSNMELPVSRVLDLYEEEISRVNNSNIRQFIVGNEPDFDEYNLEVTGGEWKNVNSIDIMDFSAVGYFFAEEMYNRYQVPIGLVLNAVGGSSIEAWMSKSTLKSFGDYESKITHLIDKENMRALLDRELKEIDKWNKQLQDKEIQYDKLAWKSCEMPNLTDELGLDEFSGLIWFRKKITINTKINKNKDALLYIGSMIDSDTSYVNDMVVGETAYRYPPRRYFFSQSLIKQGDNEIKIKLNINNGIGGFVEGMPYYLKIDDMVYDLVGEWDYAIGAQTEKCPKNTFLPLFPTGLFNSKLFSVRNYVFKAVLWYQGESNVSSPTNYKELFEAMVHEWRGLFNKEICFLYVQLANYTDPLSKVSDTGISEIRNQQRLCLSIQNTAMASAVDIGEAADLHPQNKKEVGRRLSLCARKCLFGEDIISCGPLLNDGKLNSNKFTIYFSNIGGGLICKGEQLTGFEAGNEAGDFLPVRAEIQDNNVVIDISTITNVNQIRYGWGDNPTKANLYNADGLPASPFRITLDSMEGNS